MKKLACLYLVVIAACGGSKPAETTTAGATTQAEVVLPDVPFDQLDQDQRIAFMKQKVVPVMMPIFQNHDPEEFADFSCVTCHGTQANDGHFDMPAADLPKLDFKDMSEWKKADLEWMENEVKPTMAKLLGEAELTPETPTGFGCQNCHTIVQ